MGLKMPPKTIKINKFLNREQHLKILSDSINEYSQNDSYYKLFFISGIGGIGKTAFSKEIKKNNENKLVKIKIINLAIENNDKIDLILKIRKNYDRADNFDYLFLKYWAKYRSTELNSEYRNLLEKSIYSTIKILESSMKKLQSSEFEYLCKNITLQKYTKCIFEKLSKPFEKITNLTTIEFFDLSRYDISKLSLNEFNLILKIIKLLDNKYTDKKLEYEHKEVINNMDDEDFIDELFKILAGDINNYNNKKKLIIFDSLNNESQKFYNSILNFICEVKHGIFVIIGRNKQDIEQMKNDNIGKICDFEIKKLPSNIVYDYLTSQEFNLSKENIKFIIEKTECIPFFLELALSNLKNSNTSGILEIRDKKDFMKRYMNFLTDSIKKFYSKISIIKVFNKIIIDELLRVDKYEFTNFTKLDYIEKMAEVEVYKVIDIFAENFKMCDDNEINELELIKDYINVVHKKIIFIDKPEITNIFIINILDIIFNLSLTDKLKELDDTILDLILYLNDTGYLVNLNTLFNEQNNLNSYFTNLKNLINALSVRETNISKGLEYFEKINYSEMTKKFEAVTKLEYHYVSSIKGDYDNSQKFFSDIVTKTPKQEKIEHYYLKAYLYYSDILMLRGKFIEAQISMEEIIEIINQIGINHQNFRTVFDTYKAIGHIYRFNFNLSGALARYELLFCNDNFKTNIKLNSYYYTVLCESYCFFEPLKALIFLKKAFEINEILASKNNLAKLYYSKAITLIHSKEFNKSRELIKIAYQINKSSKYEAGNIFVLLAECYVDFAEKNSLNPIIVQKLEKLTSDLKVYEYLLLPIYLMNNDIKKANALKKYEWIDFEQTKIAINKFIELIKS